MFQKLTRFLPRSLNNFQNRLIANYQMYLVKGKTTEEVFREIYRNARWGNSEEKTFCYCSGCGSVNENATPYVDFVNTFLSTHKIRSIIDLGCGDFRVGSRMDLVDREYIGCDVVAEVIQNNMEKFGDRNIEFKCMDIIEEELPDGELCLIRQVFQHLSNADILKILPKLGKFTYVLITDAQLYSAKWENLDMPTFGGTRSQINSVLFLEHSPFNMPAKSVLEYSLPTNPRYYIRTVLIEKNHSD